MASERTVYVHGFVVEQTQDRKYAEQKFAWPGGYELFAVMDDGGVLCCDCVVANWVEVSGSDGSDGWGIIGWDHSGNTDDLVSCDHCGRVIVEAWNEEE